jgi:hypothetical protein
MSSDCNAGAGCAVLCKADYEKLSQKYKEPLPMNGGLDTIEAVAI